LFYYGTRCFVMLKIDFNIFGIIKKGKNRF